MNLNNSRTTYIVRHISMITCKKCKKFVSYKTLTFDWYPGIAEVKNVRGDCKKCGKDVECDYEDFEELGIEE